MILRITDGTVTVNLTGTHKKIFEWVPKNNNGIGTVKETARILSRQNNADFRADMRTVQRLFNQARTYQKNKIAGAVFLEWDATGTGNSLYRSLVIDGTIQYADSTFRADYTLNQLQVLISWERMAFWEGAITPIPIFNRDASAQTTPIQIANHHDNRAQRINYVHIAPSSIIGDLPSPPYIKLHNNFNILNRLDEVIIGHNVYSDPANFHGIIEGESDIYSNGSTVNHPVYSNSAVRQFTIPANQTDMLIAQWQLNTSFLNISRGNTFRLTANVPTLSSRIWVKARLKFNVSTIWESDWILLHVFGNYRYVDFGAVQLPPKLAGVAGAYPLILELYGRNTETFTQNVSFDFIQFMPLDSYRRLIPVGYGLAYNATLHDVGFDDSIYTDGWTTAGKTGHYLYEGGKIMLVPNKYQQLMFQMTGQAGEFLPERTALISLSYRPRFTGL